MINNAGNDHVGKFEVMNTIKVEEMMHLNLRALTIMILIFIKDMEKYSNVHILNVGNLGVLHARCLQNCLYGNQILCVLFYTIIATGIPPLKNKIQCFDAWSFDNKS